jgi:alpha-beta hydrolase superfamily lysophospholipase
MDLRITPWATRALLIVAVIVVLVFVVLGWMHSNAIREEFLLPTGDSGDYPLTVQSNDAGRVVLPRTAESERPGVWGLESEDGYAQVSTIVRIDDDVVVRGIADADGLVSQDDAVRLDIDAFPGDPLTAHGLGFEDFAIPSDIGPHTAWFVDGRRATWVIYVHDTGTDELGQSLRVMPRLVEQGFPVLSMTYRGDVGATPSEDGMRMWGLTEWKDLDAAIGAAQRKGARDFVIIGAGSGASVVSSYLHEADDISAVRAVIYDSPVLDPEGVAARWASDSGIPAPISWLGRHLTRIRFGMEWSQLDQIERADEFDIPMLLLIGDSDPLTPTDEYLTFTESLGRLVVVERFVQGRHGDLWNIDVNRYLNTVEEFLLEIVGPE